MKMLESVRVSKSYGTQKILGNVSLHVGEGELVSLLGLSGVGKTTLFHTLSGLEVPDAGRVLLGGADITGRPGQIGYMQQKDLLLPFKTALDNAAMPLTLRGVKKKAAHSQAAPYFADFGLTGCEKKYPAQLSGGQRQRVSLLRALLFSADLLLLDEPFTALDPITKTGMETFVRDTLRQRRCAALCITHDIEEAIRFSDRIYVLSGYPGSITAEFPLPPNMHSDLAAATALKEQLRTALSST
jgi:ABC-type nitrate/sulfonate/bicarbonate transport system ATPase subunit